MAVPPPPGPRGDQSARCAAPCARPSKEVPLADTAAGRHRRRPLPERGGAHGRRAMAQSQPAAPPAVTVSHPLEREVVEWDEYTGQFAAVEYVELRARVSGYLTDIDFEDGQFVKKGDLLFVIDPRPFRGRAAAGRGAGSSRRQGAGSMRANLGTRPLPPSCAQTRQYRPATAPVTQARAGRARGAVAAVEARRRPRSPRPSSISSSPTSRAPVGGPHRPPPGQPRQSRHSAAPAGIA